MPKLASGEWPVLKSYDRNHLTCVALPLGGIGTGTISLGGRGDLRDWEVVNRPSKGFVPRFSFFSLFAKTRSGTAAKVLEGPVDPPFDSANGYRGRWYGMPRFRQAEFHAAYPLGQVILSDKDVPLTVRIEGFNPLIPADEEASGIPVAVLRFVLINPTSSPIAASVCGNLNNFVGTDGINGAPSRNVNEERQGQKARGVFLRSDGVDPLAEQWGTMALATTAASGVSVRTTWFDAGNMFESLTDFWDDFSSDGRIEERDGGGKDSPMASVCVSTRVPAGGEKAITFLIAWSFPNRQTWTPEGDRIAGYQSVAAPGAKLSATDRIGNWYSTRYADAWDVVARTVARLPALEKQTVQFVKALCESDTLPDVVKEAALFNLNSLRSQTCFRTEDGRFFGWEGCVDQAGCCPGSCTHVWNYDLATPYLFGNLSRSMRDSEFRLSTGDDGHMAFRISLPIARAREFPMAAADGQMGCLMKLYRDWQLSGDEQMLRDLWPKARKALEFAWIPGGWDADQDGVMEGVQHNTTDLEFYGPNPLMACWYLGALRAAEEMAGHLKEDGFARRCRDLYERGSRWVDEHLFDGEYYVQELRTPPGPEAIAKGLMGHAFMAGVDVTNPPQQPGLGCLTDQLVGQFLAHVCGLGRLLDREHVLATLKSIMKYNFVTDHYDHVNPIRAFALQDEKALVYGTWPKGGRPERPCFRFFENWTGIEYAAAVLMMQEGRHADALRVFKAIRDRFDGRRRNPFNEPECGHHYARAMAAWGGILALTGFRYSAVDRTLTLAPAKKAARQFWSTGYAWGTCRQRPSKASVRVDIEVLGGTIGIDRLVLTGFGEVKTERRLDARPGKEVQLTVKAD